MNDALRNVVLAVDLGGTTIKGAVIDPQGRPLFVRSMPTFAAGAPDVRGRLLATLDALAAEAASRGLHPAAAGIVAPGLVEDGRVIFASNLGWRDVDLGALAATHLHIPVAIGHDVGASGLAESLFGAARGHSEFVMVTIGTGIAAVLMSAGQMIRGASHAAGEIGHIPVVPEGEACACGQYGCLEAYASAASIARRYVALGGDKAVTAADIAARLNDDPRARQVWHDAVRALSLALATTTLLLDPALIVLGGGLSNAGAALLDPLRAALTARLAWRAPPPLALSLLGAAGGRIGAAVLGWRLVGEGDAPDSWNTEALLARPFTAARPPRDGRGDRP